MHFSDIKQEQNRNSHIEDIFSKFRAEGIFLNAEPFGGGHIHDTFHVKVSAGTGESYILQRLNNNVFRNIPQLQENIERVTNHLKKKLSVIAGSDIKRETLTPVYCENGKTWLEDNEGAFWRVFLYIDNHISFNRVEDPAMAYEGGKAVGRFLALLSDLGGVPLHETIPDFHNIEKRLIALREKVAENKLNRVKEVASELIFIEERAEKMGEILRLGSQGKIPLRITHNDTKFNNILFDTKRKGLCVIDLDTVMPGFIHYDFGDAIRTAASTATEDEQDLSKIMLDLEIFKGYAGGFLKETLLTLNETEIEYLAVAPQLMTYIQVVRFLTDYIDGDRYFKISREKHNLDRARAQIKLQESMEYHYGSMRSIIDKCRSHV
jgi:hypothetical protein